MGSKMTVPVNEIKEICFPQDTKERKQWFTGMSFSHPAKMHLSLQIYLLEHYTKAGETILDPMSGSGTILFACTLGRNVVCVELEEKFVKMQRGNWQKIKGIGPMLGHKMGEAVILQGDARDLEGLFADKILFSPPYAEALGGAGISKHNHKTCNCAFCKKNRGICGKVYQPTEHGQSKGQIANLPYGSVDKVITSPPHGNRLSDGACKDNDPQRMSYRQSLAKADTIITSPPYEGTISGKEMDESEKLVERKSGKGKWGKHLRLGRSQLTKYADTIITSPPYEEAHGKKIGGITNKNRADLIPYSWTKSENNNNIGNLKSANYLDAMLQVYRQCYGVLKDNGLLILVTKNFIRDKKLVRLDLDTVKLCEKSGFVLKERLKRKLTQQSFWRTIALMKCDNRKGSKGKCKLGLTCPVKLTDDLVATLLPMTTEELEKTIEIIEQKCPNFINTMPKIEYEDVLVFEKGLFE